MLLTRATTDLRAYERALEERGLPTYVIGGRGYWSHPQVVDMVGYLEALANPRDEEALYTVLASPLVGVVADALVVLAADRARPQAATRGRCCASRDGALDELWLPRDRVAAGVGSPTGSPIERDGGRHAPASRTDRPRARADRLRRGGARAARRAAAPRQRAQADAPRRASTRRRTARICARSSIWSPGASAAARRRRRATRARARRRSRARRSTRSG